MASPSLLLFAIVAAHGLPSPTFTDFDVMVEAGRLAREGHPGLAFDHRTMLAAAPTVAAGGWLPYSYPPTIGVLLARLAALPSFLAYLVAEAADLALLLVVAAAFLASALVASGLVACASPVPLTGLHWGRMSGHSGLAGYLLVPGAVVAASAIRRGRERPVCRRRDGAPSAEVVQS